MRIDKNSYKLHELDAPHFLWNTIKTLAKIMMAKMPIKIAAVLVTHTITSVDELSV